MTPWVSVLLSPFRGLRCDLCHLPGPLPGPDLSCPDCGLVFYCSCDCQDNDPDHGAECEVLARAGELPARDEVRVVVRAVAKLQGGGGEREGAELVEGGGEGDHLPGREGARTFDQLMSHSEKFLASGAYGGDRRKHIQRVFDEVNNSK